MLEFPPSSLQLVIVLAELLCYKLFCQIITVCTDKQQSAIERNRLIYGPQFLKGRRAASLLPCGVLQFFFQPLLPNGSELYYLFLVC